MLAHHFTDREVKGLSAGYINQEIVKLSFWELGFCENYMCIDSDSVFIREFGIADFMHDEETPYSVLYEDTDLKTDRQYYDRFWILREESLRRIQKELDYKERKLITCHGFQNMSAKVLRNFKEKYLDVKGYSYLDILKISPYEFSWYNFWLQKRKPIEIYYSGQIFFCFHMRHQLYNSWLEDKTEEDLARSYVGIILNSNFTNGEMIDYEDKAARLKVRKIYVKRFLRKIVKGWVRKND